MNEVYRYFRALTLAAILALAFAPHAGHAQTTTPPPLISGLVRIVGGQTAEINVVNISTVTLRMALSFLTGDGSVFKRVEVTVLPHHAASLEAMRAEVGPGSGRAGLYAAVALVPAVRTALPPGPCIPTLEVFDADGKTTVLDTDFHNPPSD